MKSAEDIANALGNPGKFQIIVCLMLSCTHIFTSWGHLGMTFYAAQTSHQCFVENISDTAELMPTVADNGKDVLDGCHYYTGPNRTEKSKCTNGWTYSLDNREWTIIAEWDLVCDDKYKGNLATMVYFCGVMLGSLVSGALSDRFGRKPVLLAAMYSSVVVGLIVTYSPNYIVFVSFRFILGFLLEGLPIIAYTIVMELVANQYRTVASIIPSSVAWSVGVMTLALISYLIQNWKYIQLFTTLCALLQLHLICFLPESFRWLLTRNRVKEAELVVDKVVQFNKLEFPRKLFDKVAEDTIKVVTAATRSYTILDIFKSSLLRKRWAILIFIWFAISLSYYGLSLNMSQLAGNKYLNVFIGGVCEAAIYLITVVVSGRYGRKNPLCLYSVVGGITCIIAGAIPKDKEWLQRLVTSLALFGRTSISGTFSIMFIYTLELYPTVVRNIGLGAGVFGARIGSILAPQILLVGTYTADSVPFIIFGACVLLAGVLVILLPETLHRKLPETIKEAENELEIMGKLSLAASSACLDEEKDSEKDTMRTDL